MAFYDDSALEQTLDLLTPLGPAGWRTEIQSTCGWFEDACGASTLAN